MVKTLDRDNKRLLKGQRERDLEKQYRDDFGRYEEWKLQQGEEFVVEEPPPEEPKKKGFGKFDFIFLGLGFLVALIWRGCKQS